MFLNSNKLNLIEFALCSNQMCFYYLTTEGALQTSPQLNGCSQIKKTVVRVKAIITRVRFFPWCPFFFYHGERQGKQRLRWAYLVIEVGFWSYCWTPTRGRERLELLLAPTRGGEL